MKLPLIAYLDLFSHLLPVGAGIFRWNEVRRNDEGIMFIFVFTFIAALSELSTYWMAINKIPNLWVLHFYHLGEYVFLMLYFSILIMEDTRFQTLGRVLRWSIVGFFFFWLISKWTIEKWSEPASYTHTFSTCIFIMLSLYTLFQLVVGEKLREGEEKKTSLLGNFRFWIIFGLLVYFTGSAVHFLLISPLTALSMDAAIKIWAIHWGVNVLVNILYLYGFVCLMPKYTA